MNTPTSTSRRHTSASSRLPTGHAVVIGGSVAGLLTARALSDVYDRVTVIERDVLGTDAAQRKGVPQGQHPHGILAGGLRALEALYPGISAELQQDGALPGDLTWDARWYQADAYKVRFEHGLRGLFMSRPLLERRVRERTFSRRGVSVVTAGVRDLITRDGGATVSGVRYVQLDGTVQELHADLVVDASGRGTRTPVWLQALGYDRPAETRIDVNVGYTSRLYRRSPDDIDGGLGIVTLPRQPEERRMGGMLAVEGDRWHVLLGGWLGDHAPADEEGFLAFARSLPNPDVYALLRTLEPAGDFATYRYPANVRRHYERMRRFPDGLLVLGDALCSFNPIYGQGMTVTALEVRTLQRVLSGARNLTQLRRAYFRAVAKLVEVPWSMAAAGDYSYPEVEGRRPAGSALIGRYFELLQHATTRDEHVASAFFHVANLVAPPTTLFAPGVVLRVLRHARTREQQRPGARPAPVARA